MSDETLWLEQARNGDDEAFCKLVRAYQRPVYNLAYRMLGDPYEAEDAAQEAFIRAYTKLSSYDPQRKFVTWLLSITAHHCIDRLRRRRIQFVDLEAISTNNRSAEHHPAQLEESLIHREDQRFIQDLLQTLPPHHRAVLTLRYWYDLSYQEIAEVMGTTVSAVKSHLHRARGAIAHAIQNTPAEKRPFGLSAQEESL